MSTSYGKNFNIRVIVELHRHCAGLAKLQNEIMKYACSFPLGYANAVGFCWP